MQQFGAILGTCTLRRGDPGHGDLTDRHAAAVSPGDPGPARVALAGGRGHEPADPRVYRHPGAIVAGASSPSSCRVAAGIFRLSYETNYINLFRPETRVVKDYHTVESKLGGIGLVELVVPVGDRHSAGTLARTDQDRAECARAITVSDPEAIAQVLSLATVLDPEGRVGGPAGREPGHAFSPTSSS